MNMHILYVVMRRASAALARLQWRTRAGSGATHSSQGIGEEGGNVLLIAGRGEAPHIHPARMARRLLRGRLRSCTCTEQELVGEKPMTSHPQAFAALCF